MAKPTPTYSPDTISSVCLDVNRIIEDKHLDQKGINHEVSLDGALRIGRRLERECAGYPISKLGGLLSPVGKYLKARSHTKLGPTYLTRCIKLARAVPEHAEFRPELTLEHYETLARIKDETLRQELMNAAADNGWSTWRIELHSEYQDAQSVPSIWGRHQFKPNQEVLRFARAYTDVCGIISLDTFIELYNSCAPKPVSRFEVNETVWQISTDSGKLDRPCIISKGRTLYLVAPELYGKPQDTPYHHDDYGYSYRSYERRSEYVEEMRTLRQERTNARKAAILTGHKNHPIKKLDYDDVLCGHTKYLHAAENLKRYVLGTQGFDAATHHEREDEFDFILAKLLRSVGLYGMPSGHQIKEDAVFLMIAVRPDLDEYEEVSKIARLLFAIYKQAPIWELNGHSLTERANGELQGNSQSRRHQPEPSKQVA